MEKTRPTGSGVRRGTLSARSISLYVSDIPHWDNEFPGNLQHLRGHKELSDNAKKKILYKNAKQLFGL